MAKKQGSTKQKGLSAPKTRFMARKSKTWTTAFRPGTHSKNKSIPLAFVLKDLLGVAKNSKEASFALNSANVLVDGVVRKEKNFSVGLFDVLELKALEKITG